jgi:4-hydroxy-3-methylbut-2-enyl diphosphate reductase
MKIFRADHLGMCFGVRDAITTALQKSEERPLTVLGELVHNPTVLQQLAQAGVQTVHNPAELKTETVMITAHGSSAKAMAALKHSGHQLIDGTCPLVRFAHNSLLKLAREGFFPVIIGKKDHVEVRGLTGDLDDYRVILSEEEIPTIPEVARIGVASQTTQPAEKVERLVNAIRRHFPASQIRYIDTVCQPTKQRQTAAIDLAKRCSVVVVIGGKNSNNTRELAETCRRHCAHVYQVEKADQLNPQWFCEVDTVGITAGTSTPDSVISEVESVLQRWACESVAQPAPVLPNAMMVSR